MTTKQKFYIFLFIALLFFPYKQLQAQQQDHCWDSCTFLTSDFKVGNMTELDKALGVQASKFCNCTTGKYGYLKYNTDLFNPSQNYINEGYLTEQDKKDKFITEWPPAHSAGAEPVTLCSYDTAQSDIKNIQMPLTYNLNECGACLEDWASYPGAQDLWGGEKWGNWSPGSVQYNDNALYMNPPLTCFTCNEYKEKSDWVINSLVSITSGNQIPLNFITDVTCLDGKNYPVDKDYNTVNSASTSILVDQKNEAIPHVSNAQLIVTFIVGFISILMRKIPL